MKHFPELLFLAAIVMVASCTVKYETPESRCPTWKGFDVRTSTSAQNYQECTKRNNVEMFGTSYNGVYTVSLGDYVQITAMQDERGHLINATSYSWSLCYDSIDNQNGVSKRIPVEKEISFVRTNYDGYLDGAFDPVCKFKMPTNAMYPHKRNFCICENNCQGTETTEHKAENYDKEGSVHVEYNEKKEVLYICRAECHTCSQTNILQDCEINTPIILKFVAKYSYSGSGAFYETGNIVNNSLNGGKIIPQSGPTYGGAVGYIYFMIQ